MNSVQPLRTVTLTPFKSLVLLGHFPNIGFAHDRPNLWGLW
jgi:hypothetical protein